MKKSIKKSFAVLRPFLVVLILFIAVGGVINAVTANDQKDPAVAKPDQNAAQPPTIDAILEATNKRRAEAGVAPLALSPELNRSAQEKADDMKVRNYYTHISPDGVRGYELIYKYMPKHTLAHASENLHNLCHGETADRVVESFMNSPAHKEAMLDKRYALAGLGVVADTSKPGDRYCTGFVVQHFVQPKQMEQAQHQAPSNATATNCIQVNGEATKVFGSRLSDSTTINSRIDMYRKGHITQQDVNNTIDIINNTNAQLYDTYEGRVKQQGCTPTLAKPPVYDHINF